MFQVIKRWVRMWAAEPLPPQVEHTLLEVEPGCFDQGAPLPSPGFRAESSTETNVDRQDSILGQGLDPANRQDDGNHQLKVKSLRKRSVGEVLRMRKDLTVSVCKVQADFADPCGKEGVVRTQQERPTGDGTREQRVVLKAEDTIHPIARVSYSTLHPIWLVAVRRSGRKTYGLALGDRTWAKVRLAADALEPARPQGPAREKPSPIRPEQVFRTPGRNRKQCASCLVFMNNAKRACPGCGVTLTLGRRRTS